MKLSDLMQDRDLVNRHTVPVLLSTDAAMRLSTAAAAVDAAKRKLERAQRSESGMMNTPLTVQAQAELDQAERQHADAEDEAAKHLVEFVVESLGSDAWEELVGAHPSTPEQREQLGNGDPGFNLKTFPIAAVAACLREPEVDSLDDVRDLKSKIPDIVWSQLFAAVMRVNRGPNAVPPSLTGSRAITPSGAGSEPQSS